MPVIKLAGFSGEQPRVIPRLMPEASAQSAVNTKLDDGALTPMRRSAFVANADSAAYQTIYRHRDEWLGWDSVVNAAPGPVADDRLYYTGNGAPKLLVEGVSYNLAVPRPKTALTVYFEGEFFSPPSTEPPEPRIIFYTRLYCYTWVTSLGEESEPSDVSDTIEWSAGKKVELFGFETPPAGRLITKQRIYRSQTGQTGTYFYLIAERNVTTSLFLDEVPVDGFQEPLPSVSWNAPPDGLSGLTALPNGMMAAFVGRRLYFCEPFRPHAWPEKYVLTLDTDIVGLGAVGSTILVLTTGQPYFVQGATPESMQMQRIEANFPCINARSIVDLGYAIAFASNEGLVVATGDGQMKIATPNIFSRDDWLALSPHTMIGAQIDGRYVAFYSATGSDGEQDEGMLLIDLSGTSYLIRSDAKASAAVYDVPTSALYYLEAGSNDIRQFDAPNARRLVYYWKSKEFVLPYPENFGAILIDTDRPLVVPDPLIDDDVAAVIAANRILIAAGSIGGDLAADVIGAYSVAGDMLGYVPKPVVDVFNVRIYADKKAVAEIKTVNTVVRLPSGFTARTWEVDVSSDVQVQRIAMAKSVDELRNAT